MTITSFVFFAFIAIGAIMYYILPKSWQWVELFIMSIVFYYFAATPYTLIFLGISTVVAYLATNIIQVEKIKTINKLTSVIISIAIIINILLWFVIKGTDLWIPITYRLSLVFPIPSVLLQPTGLIAALGMGYYTLQVIGYILDCYWGTIKPQKNLAKLFLFVSFFPQLTTGPISRYSQLQDLFENHKLSYLNVTHGSQRILWGLFKKLVIVDRVGTIVHSAWSNMETFTGVYSVLALLSYPLQIYADFSGCMDIVIGTAEIFGIILPENFKNPFFSRTVQEFWQRWHITLGTWAKDYVLYPLLKSKPMIRFGKISKKKFGKRVGKFLPTMLGMFCLWMVMGIWHGGFKYVIGVSLWYFMILMFGELFSPLCKRINHVLHINEECFSWHLFQSIRTYIIYAIGAVFFRAGSIEDAICFLKNILNTIKEPNVWIIFSDGILKMGSTYSELNIILFSILLLIVVAILREKYGYARLWMDKQFLVFRWSFWIGLIVLVLILGQYGPEYNAKDFIYEVF